MPMLVSLHISARRAVHLDRSSSGILTSSHRKCVSRGHPVTHNLFSGVALHSKCVSVAAAVRSSVFTALWLSTRHSSAVHFAMLRTAILLLLQSNTRSAVSPEMSRPVMPYGAQLRDWSCLRGPSNVQFLLDSMRVSA